MDEPLYTRHADVPELFMHDCVFMRVSKSCRILELVQNLLTSIKHLLVRWIILKSVFNVNFAAVTEGRHSNEVLCDISAKHARHSLHNVLLGSRQSLLCRVGYEAYRVYTVDHIWVFKDLLDFQEDSGVSLYSRRVTETWRVKDNNWI